MESVEGNSVEYLREGSIENFIKTQALLGLKREFPNAIYVEKSDLLQQNALKFFQNDWNNFKKIKLHLKGTPFQLKVWEALLKIPSGGLSTYGLVSKSINKEKAFRAVGTAIAGNKVAFLIPCHRVIRAGGEFGQYRWGAARKMAIIGLENVNL